MPDVGTQLREYFDAAVERVTAEDVFARRRVFEEMGSPRRHFLTLHPAWAAALGFAVTVIVLGGTLGLTVLTSSRDSGAGSRGLTDIVEEATGGATGSWLFIVTIAVAIAGVVAVVVIHHQRAGKERTMAATITPSSTERTTLPERHSRSLITTIVVLVIALLALGAWVVYDAASEPEAATPEALQTLLDDYMAAWNAHDADAFMALTTEDFTMVDGAEVKLRTNMASLLRGVAQLVNFRVTRLGEPGIVGSGPYYVADQEQVQKESAGGVLASERGVSLLTIVETEAGLRVAEHVWIGVGPWGG